MKQRTIKGVDVRRGLGKHAAEIAQLGERQTEDLKVPGSIPGFGTNLIAALLLVGCHLRVRNISERLIVQKVACIDGESNPGLPRGRREFYH